MDIFTLFAGSVLIVAMSYLALRLAVVIAFNVRTGMLYRQKLARKITDLRLNRMLSALGIDINKYLHSERIIDINDQMERCVSCENTQKCDEELSRGKVSADSIGYCNNEQVLREIVTANRSGGTTD